MIKKIVDRLKFLRHNILVAQGGQLPGIQYLSPDTGPESPFRGLKREAKGAYIKYPRSRAGGGGMSGYCPAGKCECREYKQCGCTAHARGGIMDVGNFEQCPWPSRQVRVEKGNDPVAMHEAVIRNESFKHGLAEGIRRAREAVEVALTRDPNTPINGAEFVVAQAKQIALAAIDAVEGD